MRITADRLPRMAAAIALACAIGSGTAEAHVGGTTGFATITVEGQTVRYVLTLSIGALEQSGILSGGGPLAAAGGSLADLPGRRVAVIADGASCAPLPGTATSPGPGRPSITATVLYACPAPPRSLLLRDQLFVELGRDHHTLANIEWPEGRDQLVFDPDHREARIALAGEPIGPSGAESAEGGPWPYFRMGVEHILTGFDHILFLLALMLRGGRIGSLIGIVTAFTVAHSVTLSLAVLHVATLPSRLVEPLIALSIAYVALENMLFRRAPSRRWAVSFGFGLVHGFGFAGALLELGLPRGSLVEALVFFNVGVEAGQAMILALLLPGLLWMYRFAWERRAVAAFSAVLFVAALALFIDRALFSD
jgi:hydrogenase/urease accessory protein HupE